MALSLVTSNSAFGAGTTSIVSPNFIVQAGDLIVITVAFRVNTESITTVTDTLGTTYARAVRNNGGGTGPASAYEVWWGVAVAAGTGAATASWTNAVASIIWDVVARSTAGTAWAVHVSSSFTETAAVTAHNCAAVGALDTTVAEAILIGGGASPSSMVPSAASGFTLVSSSSSRSLTQYKITTAVETDQRAAWVTNTAVTSNNALVAFAVLTALDPKIVLLIGAETAIVDESSYARTLTATGNAARTTAQFKYGSASLTFDGAADWVTAPASADFNFGSGDFTIEGWFRFLVKTTDQAIMGRWVAGSWFFYLEGGVLKFRISAVDVTASFTPTLGQWYHLAVDRSGNTLRLYVNGAVVATNASYTHTIPDGSDPLYLGSISGSFSSYDFTGQMDEVRVTKGLAQYAGAFTPPTAAFPRDSPSGANTKWRLNISATNDPVYIGIAKLTMSSAAGGADLCTGGTASASQEYSATYTAAKAFDADPTTYWSSTGSAASIQYEFASPVVITAYSIQAYGSGGVGTGAQYTPKSWTLEYWDGSAWQVADTRTNETGWQAREIRSFPLVSKMRWRIAITATRTLASTYAELAEVQLRATASGANQATDLYKATADTYYGAGATYSGGAALDGNGATAWTSNNGPYPHYWYYWFAGPVDIVEYVLQAPIAGENQYAPKSWSLEYWDLSAWVPVDTRAEQAAWTAGESRTFAVGAVVTTIAQLSQLPVETLILSDVPIAARLSQLPLESLVLPDVPITARLSQLPIEVLHSSLAAPILAQLSQLPLEVLHVDDTLIVPVARLAQLPVEVLLETLPSPELAVTQLPLELSSAAPGSLAVTQLSLELSRQEDQSAITATQLVVEVARDLHSAQPSQAVVSQLLIEIIRRNLPLPQPPFRASGCALPLDAAPPPAAARRIRRPRRR